MASTGQTLFLLMGTSLVLLGLSSCATTQPQSPHDVVMLISKVVDEDKRKTICAVDSATVMDLVSALAVYEKQHPSVHAQLSEAYIQTALSQAFPCSSDAKKVTVAQAPGPELETSANTLRSRVLLQAYAEGHSAYQRKDYRTAFNLFKAASDAGDVRSSHSLGNMYLLGLGVEKNTTQAVRLYEQSARGGNILSMNMLAGLYLGEQGVEKNLSLSREWARRSARAGNAEGAFFLFRALLIDPDLEYRENGKPNLEKYNKLAKRPASERSLEIEGYDMLARAAQQGHLQARILLATVYVDKPGEDNNRKALAIYQSIQNLPEPLERVKNPALPGGAF